MSQTLLEPRWYKNDSIQSKTIPSLKLPPFFTTYTVREKGTVEVVISEQLSWKVSWFLKEHYCPAKNHTTLHDHVQLVTFSIVYYGFYYFANGPNINIVLERELSKTTIFRPSLLRKWWLQKIFLATLRIFGNKFRKSVNWKLSDKLSRVGEENSKRQKEMSGLYLGPLWILLLCKQS